MSVRHNFAIAALQTNDLLELCKLLSGAVQNALFEGQMPYMDPAVNMIAHQIAFSGNGDFRNADYYIKCIEYCAGQIDTSINDKPTAPTVLFQ